MSGKSSNKTNTAERMRANLASAAAAGVTPAAPGQVRPSSVLAAPAAAPPAAAPANPGGMPLREASRGLLVGGGAPEPAQPVDATPKDTATPPAGEEAAREAFAGAKDRLAALKKLGTVPVTFRGQDVEATPEQLIESHQKMLSLGNFEERRREIQADVRGYNAYLDMRKKITEDPDLRRRMEAVLRGEPAGVAAAPQVGPAPIDGGAEGGEEPQAQTGADPRILQAIEQLNERVQSMERVSHATQQQSQQRDFERELDQAVASDPWVTDLNSKEFNDMVKSNAAALIHSSPDEFRYPSQAVPVVVAQLKNMFGAIAERERQRNEEQANQFRSSPGTGGSPFVADIAALRDSMPEPVPGGLTRNRSGVKSQVKDWLSTIARAQTSA